ncbi:hypothetical protein IP91_02567 [Pseudoduganella lurida]|uniref:Uncharacterized protein n=1 Tax=Pseudoduganella lurida TaxID=1036180 RepID=A0A562R9R7_9BURK|nr:hypothetical protein [Pseudoduganella lurida]TWI65160.1 hypothetical protein IP91_02567 [Pseudoduganella lurida]
MKIHALNLTGDGWTAFQNLANELERTHGAPFTEAFIAEYWEVVLRILQDLTSSPKSCQKLQ